jgi:hypothetical protein
MARDSKTAHERLDKIENHLSVHEAVCAERWKETILRIKRLELILITCSGAVIAFLAHIAFN